MTNRNVEIDAEGEGRAGPPAGADAARVVGAADAATR